MGNKIDLSELLERVDEMDNPTDKVVALSTCLEFTHILYKTIDFQPAESVFKNCLLSALKDYSKQGLKDAAIYLRKEIEDRINTTMKVEGLEPLFGIPKDKGEEKATMKIDKLELPKRTIQWKVKKQ